MFRVGSDCRSGGGGGKRKKAGASGSLSALPKLEPECRHQLRIYPKAVFSPDRWRLSRDAKLCSFCPIQSYTAPWDFLSLFYWIVIEVIARTTSLCPQYFELVVCLRLSCIFPSAEWRIPANLIHACQLVPIRGMFIVHPRHQKQSTPGTARSGN